MHKPLKTHRLTKEQLEEAIERESKRFEEYYSWIEKHMPAKFFEEVDENSIILIIYSLMGFDLNDYFSHIRVKDTAFILSLDSPDVDLRILKHYRSCGIKSYRSFLSNEPPPFREITSPLRITRIVFSDHREKEVPLEAETEIVDAGKSAQPAMNTEDVHRLLQALSPSFLKAMTKERLVLALDMLFRAKSRDNCQYQVRYNEEWKEKKETPSLQVSLRGAMSRNTISSIVWHEVIHRHGLS